LKLECVSPVSVICITAKVIFMVDFDDFGWLFMVDFGWLFLILLVVHGWQRGTERGREKILIKKV
jgi:hypothetical protein